MKIPGRNDPCWCGSGKKYKYCHLNRENLEPPKIQEALNLKKKIFGKKYCMHPLASKSNCSNKISRAHTVQKHGGLDIIAENGHVQSFLYGDLLKDFKTNLRLNPHLIGINIASTFPGFCSIHDNELFSPFEKGQFKINQKNCFLLGYRALCRELFVKTNAKEFIIESKEYDKGSPISYQIEYQNKRNLTAQSLSYGVKDLSYHKLVYDEYLLEKDFRNTKYYVIATNSIPDILCSGAFIPYYDYEGKLLQNGFNPNILDFIFFNIVTSENKGYIIFNWLEDQPICQNFISGINKVPLSVMPDVIVRLIVSYFENFYWKPSWWNNLTSAKKAILIEKLKYDSPIGCANPHCLQPDGYKYVNWKISNIKTNAKL